MPAYKHFRTGTQRPVYRRRLEDEEYGRALDTLVVACADCWVIDPNGKILLGKRAWEPIKDWWIIGGRMCKGESVEQAAVRNLERELKLRVPPTRFRPFAVLSLDWPTRAQKPVRNGCHTLSVVSAIYVTWDEIIALHPNEEYRDIRWRDIGKIVNGRYHPAVKHLAHTWWSHLGK